MINLKLPFQIKMSLKTTISLLRTPPKFFRLSVKVARLTQTMMIQ